MFVAVQGSIIVLRVQRCADVGANAGEKIDDY